MLRIIRAFGYSLQGFFSALKHETAFLQEMIVLLVIIGLVCFLELTAFERFILIASWGWVMIVELLNSGLELICDEITLERRERIKRVKDYGSCAVLISILISLGCWGAILIPKYIA